MTRESIISLPLRGSVNQTAIDEADGFFDESRFVPRPELRDDYAAGVARGYEQMREQRVVIAGLARDIAHILPSTIARIERLGSCFGDYRVVIYENDSQDETPTLLAQWRAVNPRVVVVSEQRSDPVNLPTRCLSRAARMAYYRSQCQQTVRHAFADFDYVVLVDTDLLGGWSYDGVAHSFAQQAWDFVGANGLIYRRQGLNPNAVFQYDAWAFRNDRCFTPLSTKQVNRMLYHRGEPLQTVYSCFGGLGIYRMPAYLAGRYDGSDVEHVTFHRVLHRRGFNKTYLNPSLITVYGRRHRSLDAWAARILRVLDALPHRRVTNWHFAATNACSQATQPTHTKRAA